MPPEESGSNYLKPSKVKTSHEKVAAVSTFAKTSYQHKFRLTGSNFLHIYYFL